MRPILSYEEEMQLQEEYLDKIEMSKYLDEGKSLFDVMDDIECDIDNLPPLPEIFDGYVFYYMGVDEFGDYLKKRGYCRYIQKEIKYFVRL